MRNNYKEGLWKGILIFFFFLLSIALLITWNTPATGYESSIYHSTPLILWAGIIASVIAGTSLVVITIAKNELKKHQLWKSGLLLIYLSYTICLSLFIIRGYFMWCMSADPASHIGWIKEILYYGNIPSSLFYPITHIFISEFYLISGLDLVYLHKIFPLIFGILCILFMYIFSKILFNNSAGAIIAVIISCCMIFGWYLNLTPNALANLYIPFVLFIVIRYLQIQKFNWGIMLIIAILISPVFHPLMPVFLGICFFTIWIPIKLPEIIMDLRKLKIQFLKYFFWNGQLLLPIITLVTWSIVWISLFFIFKSAMVDIFSTLNFEDKISREVGLLDQISYAEGYGYSALEQIVKRLGGTIILLTISILSFPLLLKRFKEKNQDIYIFSLYGPFCLIMVATPILYLFNLFGPLRFVVYLSIFGTVFTTWFFLDIISQKKNESLLLKRLKIFIIIVIIFGLFLSGLFNLYPSPYNLTPNYETSQSEVAGTQFVFEHHDHNSLISGISISFKRYIDAFLSPERKMAQQIQGTLERVPWHFGYDTYSSISYIHKKIIYLIIIKKDIIMYREIFPNMAQYRFTEKDFERLKRDTGINSIYSNGEFDFLKISPSSE